MHVQTRRLYCDNTLFSDPLTGGREVREGRVCVRVCVDLCERGERERRVIERYGVI